jgi:hypothetical protein
MADMSIENDITHSFKRPSAFLPILLSLAALATIGVHLAIAGPAPQADEGTAAHLWQVLMAAQVPLTAFFFIRWVPTEPRSALLVFAAQIAAALLAAAPVYFLKW